MTDPVANPKENLMTTTTSAPATATTNPHRIATLITGWAIPLVFVGGLWGAGHQPENAAWSAVAIVAIVTLYAVNKVRSLSWEHRNRGAK